MACCASDDGSNEPGGMKPSAECEAILRDLGFAGCRVLADGPAARIEVAADQLSRLSDPEVADAVHEGFRRLGFLYVSIDLGEGGIGAPDDGGLVGGAPEDLAD